MFRAKETKGNFNLLIKYFSAGLFFAMMALGLGQPGIAQAEEDGYGPGQDRWKFELGGFFPAIDTELEVNGTNVGTVIDLEDLGYDENESIFRLDGYWRFARKHRLGFGFYQFNREGNTVLTRDINIGDQTFPLNARTSSELDLGFYTIDYRYSLYQSEKWEIAGGLGLYWVDFAFSFAASVDVNNNPLPGAPIFESTDFNGPLPFLVLSFEYYITPKWLAIIKASYFQLNVEDIDGRLTTLGAKLEYQFTKRWGLGLGYDSFRIDVDADDDNLSSTVDYNYHGIQVYGILRF
jgi:hypothetical protein